MKVKILFLLLLSLILVAILCSCATPVPPTGASSPAGIKWDGNKQDAGIDAGTSGGLPCSQSYHNQYLIWFPKYGAAARAPANPFTQVEVVGQKPWLVTGEGAQAYEAMNRAFKLTLPPASAPRVVPNS